MKFKKVAQTFDAIEQISSRTEITQLLAHLFHDASDTDIRIVCNLALGTLRPSYEGMQFNIAQKTLIAIVARVFNQSVADITVAAKTLGDIGALFAVAQQEDTVSLTVMEIYACLSEVEKISGIGSQEEKAEILFKVLKAVSGIEAKYIVRIILGTLRLGFSDMTIIDALSWMIAGDKSLHAPIEHAYNVCADLGLIASILKREGIKAVEQVDIHIGIPIRPAGAERLPDAQAIIEKIGPCVAQPKLDGFRLQIHIDKRDGQAPTLKFFSRHLIDMSAMFPDLVDALAQMPVRTLIVEGEAIAYDPYSNSFLPFQETAKRKRKHGIEAVAVEFPLRVYLFDLLYCDGESYLHKAHETRRKKLASLVEAEHDARVQLVAEKQLADAQELETYFLAQLEHGLEGIVVKRPHAQYQAGKRNFNWIKLKYHAAQQLEDTIDCVILGYYAGGGKRAAFGIGAFLVGVYNKHHDQFETIAKVGTGLSDDGWRELKQRCDKEKAHAKPNNVHCAKELIPDVWVYPVIVCTILADEITISPLHAAGKTTTHLGYALRFPRFVMYREDKSAIEATTVDEVKRLYENQNRGS
ncbi:MAG: ATP-dependent DNA ligase [Candidatus Babeliales bacterium]